MTREEARLYAWVRANRKGIEKLMDNPELWEKGLRLLGLR